MWMACGLNPAAAIVSSMSLEPKHTASMSALQGVRQSLVGGTQ